MPTAGFNFFLYDVANPASMPKRAANGTYGHLFIPNTISGVGSGDHKIAYSLFSFGPFPGSLSNNYFYDFYFRIWAFPKLLTLTNPRRNSDIPFGVWNSYPVSDILVNLVPINAAGVTTDIVTPTVFKGYEYRVQNMQLGNSTPNVLDASLGFTFSVGADTLKVHALLATVLSIPPEMPVTETWEWYSDVLTSFDGTEQRISLRGPPRRTIKFDSRLLTTDDYRLAVRSLLFGLSSPILLPFFQYATDVTQLSVVGSTQLFINHATTDLHLGDNVFLYGTQGQMTARVVGINSDNIIIDSPTSFPMRPGDMVIPTFSCWVANKTKVEMNGFIEGKLPISAETSGPPHSSHSRPTTTAQLQTVDGLPIITYIGLGNTSDDFGVETGGEWFDYKTGLRQLITTWKNNRFFGTREYLIHRYLAPNEMDWWRDFTNYCQGKQKPFLMSTNRPDFVAVRMPAQGSDRITFTSSDYKQYFFDISPAVRYLAINTASGVHYCKVIEISIETGTALDLVSIFPPLPNVAGWNQISQISLMMRCRLNSDVVTLTHGHLESIIQIQVQSAEQ